MESQIQSYLFSKKNPRPVTIFGYATKSLPGLEINGAGKYGKTMKEKIVFLTRSRQLAIPLKRYVITLDTEDDELEAIRWLDFPVMTLYWWLAGLVPAHRLESCLAVGQIHPAGTICEPWNVAMARTCEREELTLLSGLSDTHTGPVIPAAELLGHIPQLKWTASGPAPRLPSS